MLSPLGPWGETEHGALSPVSPGWGHASLRDWVASATGPWSPNRCPLRSHPVHPLLGGDPGMQARAAPYRGTDPRTEGLPEGIRRRTAPAGEEVPPGQGLIGSVAAVCPPGLTRGCPPRGYPHWGKGPRWVLRAQPAGGTSLSSSLLCVGTCGHPGAPLTGIPG